MSSTFSAVVLAAGRSTRMGRDKALLEVDGQPLWRRQRDVLATAGAREVYLSARPDQPWVRAAAGFDAVLYDALTGCGPVVGISAAIERAAHTHVAVLAIDLPRMTPEWFQRLAAQCERGVGIVGRRAECFEPLAAIYPQEIKRLILETIAGGDYSMQRLIFAALKEGFLREFEITSGAALLFENWNEPVPVPRNPD